MVEPRIPDDQDELEELPPLDGDSRDPPEGEPNYGDLLDESADDASLDDSTSEDEPVDPGELDLDETESGWIGEASESSDLDLGDLSITDFSEGDSSLADMDEPGVGEEDFGFGNAPEREGLDPGEEGPVDADEELKDADLPALDADEEGDLQDSALVDPSFASDEPLGLPWADRPWIRVGAPVALVGATAVACAARGALVAARMESGAAELARIDLEGTCERLAAAGVAPGEVRGLAVEGATVVCVMADGRLSVSRDGGQHFSPLVGQAAEGQAAVEAVFVAGRLWVRTRAGGLLVLGEGVREPIERCPLQGIAAAIAADGSNAARAAAVLVVDGGQRPTAIVRAAVGAPILRDARDAPEARLPAVFAFRGHHVAYAARRNGLVLHHLGAAPQLLDWEGAITALAFVDDDGTLVASTYSDADDTSTLVRVGGGAGPSVVARIGAAHADADSDGRVVAMAYDEARSVVWVGGGFGVAAFSIRS